MRRLAAALVVLITACHENAAAPSSLALDQRAALSADSVPPSDTLPPPPDTLPPPPDTLPPPPDTLPPPPDTLPPPPVDSTPVARVIITPNGARASVGDSLGFFATLRARDGHTLTGPVSWSLADSSVARIEGAFGQSVIVRALSAGTTRLTASSGGKQDAVTITVRRR